ncbi:related to Sms-3 endoribonuclease Dicer (Helicase with RNase motif) [Cephalotrichum gorgonifer]|uniref:Dicer-like protein 1 n=1 Tax=Cephalotrichum gorgonifer TaxID=2041049 RepID=A0AAE8MQW1_9PEZI|nr:related to Sms-3 endoribonuclease Dicer (Helicase with RNase motif) [Cephalotrichum gorgonifer]
MDSDAEDLMRFSPPGSPLPPERETYQTPFTSRSPAPCVPTQGQLLVDTSGCSGPPDYDPFADILRTHRTLPVSEGIRPEPTKKCVEDLADLDPVPVQVIQDNSSSFNDTTTKSTVSSHLLSPSDPGCDGSDTEDSEDKYRLESAPIAPRKVSEKKRHDSAIFQSFLHSSGNAVNGRLEELSRIGTGNVDKISTAAIVRQSQSHQILNSPREYQVELFERAKEKNTIVVLDTGSGKTLIAILLLRHVVEQELERRAAGEARRVAFFIVEKIALVDQQWSAVVSNLPYPVAKFFGQDMDGCWNKEFWRETLERNEIIVCTAAILQKCLAQGFTAISRISLLILDEAHHAKKSHAYARIIKDYYLREPDHDKRPRILGMTASPVDGKSNVHMAATQLEMLLCSEIATVSSGRLAQEFGRKTHEEIRVPFERLEMRPDTDLMRKMGSLLEADLIVDRYAKYARSCAVELGPWCTDRFWKLCFAEEQMPSIMARAEGFAQQFRGTIMFCREEQNPVSIVQKVYDVVKEHPLPHLSLDHRHLSHKSLLLISILGDSFREPSDHKCIVFVEKRNTAMMLAEVLKQLQSHVPYLKPAYLVGYHADSGPLTMSYRDAVLAIHQFRKGEVNCLFASSVAEEGLDIPDCDIIIRFDLCNSMIQYIQSRGRARHENSKYINMYEKDNWDHSRKLAQASQDVATLRRFCSTLPKDRRLDSDQDCRQNLHEYSAQPSCVIKSSGAKLTFADSLQVLATFVSSFQERSQASLVPEYFVMAVGKEYVAQVILPDKSPIQTKNGCPQPNKHAARCSAAFELCKDLIREKYIDEHLQPIFKKKLPAMRNARLAISSNKKSQYKMLLKPAIWSHVGPSDHLYCTALTLENPTAVGRATCPLLLLTRYPLPTLPDIPLFFGGGENSLVRQTQLSSTLCVSKGGEGSTRVLESLNDFTLRVFHDVFSKRFEAASNELPYFLAPSCKDHDCHFSQMVPQDAIDWQAIQTVVENEVLELGEEDNPEIFYKDRFVIDPYDGGRKLYSVKVRQDLKPSDPVPEGVPAPGFKKWKSVEQNIREYSISIWSRARATRVWKENQPVVEAQILSMRRNLLDDFDGDKEASGTCFVIMEPLLVSAISARVVAMAYTFPAIIHRIDAQLIALDACEMLGLTIRPGLALEAVTKDSDNSDDAREEQINFQGGMGSNYERLEFLGDSFLKMATTIALFTQNPDENEFAYHVERMLLICNKNLFNTAVDKGLQEYVRSKSFNRRTWYPSGLKLQKGKAPQQEDGHSLSDKSVADVCEALIGAAYLSYSDEETDRDPAKQPDFDMAIRAVTAVVRNKNHKMQCWSDYHAGYEVPAWQAALPTATMRETARIIEAGLGYRFKYPALLRSAFKHPSYPYEKVPNYQCLEFLGDALLDMVCVDFLFKKFPNADPQWLTEHKMAIVSNQFLGCLCVKLGLYRHLLSIHSTLIKGIEAYVEELSGAEVAATQADGKVDEAEDSRSLWMNVSAPPKCLPDIVEAYIGAVFVDSGYDYCTVRRFFDKNIRPYFEDMSLYDSFANRHPVTFLATKLAKEFKCTDWRVLVKEDAPAAETAGAACFTQTEVAAGVLIHGKVFSVAKAASGRYAKVAAAKGALKKLEEVSADGFRAEFGCECGEAAQGGTDGLEAHGMAI